MELLELLDTVALTKDIPEHGLRVGELGTIVDICRHCGTAFEVEFTSPPDGMTRVLLTLDRDAIRPTCASDCMPNA